VVVVLVVEAGPLDTVLETLRPVLNNRFVELLQLFERLKALQFEYL
jgi:hypothetical protein